MFSVLLHSSIYEEHPAVSMCVCVQVISVNFDPFYRNEKQVCRKDTFYTNYTTITFQDDIFTQKTENITRVCQHTLLSTFQLYTVSVCLC